MPLAAQFEFFSPKGSFAVEVSLENAKRLRLPIYRNAITSLTCIGDYAIGGTRANKGLSPFLFAVSLTSQRLEAALDLAKILPGQRSIQSGFGRVGNVLYAGTMPDKEGSSGHLIKVQFTGKRFEVSDLGEPVKGEGIFALTIGIRRKMLYGITHPSGNFFTYNIQTGQVEVYEETAVTERQLGYYHQYAIEPEDFLSRALVVDKSGRIYGSKPVNSVFRFNPQTGNLVTLKDELPVVWGRRALGRVDAWAVAPDGTLYGGNAGDGQLFKIDPATGSLTNLGKPVMMPRLVGLAFGGNGKLYGVAGALPGYAHLFVYDPASGGFADLGNPRFPLNAPEIAGELPWRGFQIATVAASEDGSYILMGEDESLSQLMVFPVK
jgi:hypothetical protein